MCKLPTYSIDITLSSHRNWVDIAMEWPCLPSIQRLVIGFISLPGMDIWIYTTGHGNLVSLSGRGRAGDKLYHLTGIKGWLFEGFFPLTSNVHCKNSDFVCYQNTNPFRFVCHCEES